MSDNDENVEVYEFNHVQAAVDLDATQSVAARILASLEKQHEIRKKKQKHKAVRAAEIIVEKLESIRTLLDDDWYHLQERGTPHTQSPYYVDPSESR